MSAEHDPGDGRAAIAGRRRKASKALAEGTLQERCDDCGRHKATQADYSAIPEGEGEHLCWGPSANCEPASRAELHQTIADLDRWRTDGLAPALFRLAESMGIDHPWDDTRGWLVTLVNRMTDRVRPPDEPAAIGDGPSSRFPLRCTPVMTDDGPGYTLDPDGAIPCRRVRASELPRDIEAIVERLDSDMGAGELPEAWGDYHSPMVVAREGAAKAFDAWLDRWVEIRAWICEEKP